MKVSEKVLEKRLNNDIESLGGMTIKLIAGVFSGLPDRLCLMPRGKIFFVEVKTTGEKPRKLQKIVFKRLQQLGFKVFILDDYESLHTITKWAATC